MQDVLSDPVYKEIVAARVRLLLEKPFYGQMACRLVTQEVTWCDTMATDGRHLFWNREFVKSLTQDELMFVVAHEIMHCVLDHIGRRGHREKGMWNMAIDYITNYNLVSEHVGTMPKMGLYDKRYTDELYAEELYELLKKNSVTIKVPLDFHLDADGSGEGDDDGNGGGEGKGDVEVRVTGGKDGPPKLTEEDLARIRNEVRSAMLQTASALGAGKVPLGVRRLIDSLVQPKLDWRAMLDAHIRSSVKDDYTFQRLSRRSFGAGALLPSQDFMDTVDIVVAIDMSGSIGQEQATEMLSEVKGIMDTFRDYKVTVFTFDHDVYNCRTFTPENGEDLLSYEVKGGGGTSFEACYEFMKKEGIEPKRFIMFTDGYPNGTWGDPNYCDTLFVIHGSTSIVAPFGITAYYDEPNKKLASGKAAAYLMAAE